MMDETIKMLLVSFSFPDPENRVLREFLKFSPPFLLYITFENLCRKNLDAGQLELVRNQLYEYDNFLTKAKIDLTKKITDKNLKNDALITELKSNQAYYKNNLDSLNNFFYYKGPVPTFAGVIKNKPFQDPSNQNLFREEVKNLKISEDMRFYLTL